MTLAMQAKGWTKEQVADVIAQVNNYWQQNNKAETRSFWDPAAYHTGNMEAYKRGSTTANAGPSTTTGREHARRTRRSGNTSTMARDKILCSSAIGRYASRLISTFIGLKMPRVAPPATSAW